MMIGYVLCKAACVCIRHRYKMAIRLDDSDWAKNDIVMLTKPVPKLLYLYE